MPAELTVVDVRLAHLGVADYALSLLIPIVNDGALKLEDVIIQLERELLVCYFDLKRVGAP